MAATRKKFKKTTTVKSKKSSRKKKPVSLKPPRLKKALAAKSVKLKSTSKSTAKKTAKVKMSKVKSAAKKKSTGHISKLKHIAKHAPRKADAKPVMLKTARAKKGKSVSYSKQDLNHFRELILEKIREANDELISIEDRLMDATSGEYNDEDSTYSMHMAEQGTDAMEREKAFLFAARERKFISHLEDAIQRIASGNYGVCISCGNLIDKGRLEVVPHARMCVNCKNDSKRGGE